MYFVNCVICGNEPILKDIMAGYTLIECKGCGIQQYIAMFSAAKEECIQQWNDKQTKFAEHIVERFAEPVRNDSYLNSKVIGWKIGKYGRPTKADLVMDLLTGGE